MPKCEHLSSVLLAYLHAHDYPVVPACLLSSTSPSCLSACLCLRRPDAGGDLADTCRHRR